MEATHIMSCLNGCSAQQSKSMGETQMPNQTYQKLVRDRIPEIIRADGKICITEVLSETCYLEMLDSQLEQVRQEKAARRGSFDEKILLKEVRER